MQPLSPRQVIRGFNRREANAIRWVYDTYYPYISGFVEKLSGVTPDTADLIDEVFAKLTEYPRYFDKVQQIKRFLYSTAKNSCLNYNKHQQIVKSKSEEVARYYQAIEEDTLKAAEVCALSRDMYFNEIDSIPAKLKEIFRLYFDRDLSNREIAEKLGVSEKTVANRKSVALKTVKAEILKRRDKFF